MPRTLKILQVGAPVLRQPARPLTRDELLSESIQQLIVLLRETMRDAPGVGLAAPQVGEPVQLVVIEDRAEYHRELSPEQLAERERTPVPFHVLANPRLTVLDAGPREFFEGCLSLSGFTALVPRAAAVRVEALDERGEPVAITARGWYARILQHELDHLNGVLYIDRMRPRSFMTLENYQRHWKHLPLAEVRAMLSAPPPGRAVAETV